VDRADLDGGVAERVGVAVRRGRVLLEVAFDAGAEERVDGAGRVVAGVWRGR
jgi:hypothetical protein